MIRARSIHDGPTHHARVGVLGAVAERGRERGRAALVVVRVLAVVDGRVDGYGPHGRRVAVAVAVVVRAAVAARPHVDVAQAAAALVHAAHDGAHGGVARPVHRLAVVRRAPRRAVDVDQVRLVAHRVGLDQVRHVRLVQHADTFH